VLSAALRSARRRHARIGKTGGTQRPCPPESGQRQPTGSGDRFAPSVASPRRASGGIEAIAEIVAHTARTSRPAG